MAKKRVVAFVDGFNLYHAIDNLNEFGPYDYLKWINLHTLVETFVPAPDFDLVAVKYFSAFAELAAAAGGASSTRRMQLIHLQRSLFPRDVKDVKGQIAAIRPSKYDPPK